MSEGCREFAIYGYIVSKHCENHHLGDEIDLIQRRCVGCGLPGILDQIGLCGTCDPDLYKRLRLAKQKGVKDFCDANHLTYISYDKMIDHGISCKKRPDFIFKCESHMIVVEVDEDQHMSYQCENEQERMCLISQTLKMKTLFIRYNPDRYSPLNGKPANKEHERLTALKQQIEYWQQHPLPEDGLCFVTYLYFDDDDPSQWKNLNKLI
jgi:hypothetical protein